MMESADLSLRDSVKIYDEFRAKCDEIARQAEPYLNDPTISEGSKAAIRTSLNAALACGDLLMTAGIATSLSATALKGVAKLDKLAKWFHRSNQKDKDGKTSAIQSFDLTPDVKLRTSIVFQILELCSAGVLPMRTVEGLMQIAGHDLARIWRAYKRIREIAAAKAKIAPDVQNAIDVFQPEGGTV